MRYEAVIGGGRRRIEVEPLGEGRYRVGTEERQVDQVLFEGGVYSLLIDGASYEVTVRDEKKGFLVEIGAHLIPVRLDDPSQSPGKAAGEAMEGEAVLSSPMPGRVVGIKVQEGELVKAGQGVILVEAMKMENELHSPKGGQVKKIAVRVGDAVEAGQELVVIG